MSNLKRAILFLGFFLWVHAQVEIPLGPSKLVFCYEKGVDAAVQWKWIESRICKQQKAGPGDKEYYISNPLLAVSEDKSSINYESGKIKNICDILSNSAVKAKGGTYCHIDDYAQFRIAQGTAYAIKEGSMLVPDSRYTIQNSDNAYYYAPNHPSQTLLHFNNFGKSSYPSIQPNSNILRLACKDIIELKHGFELVALSKENPRSGIYSFPMDQISAKYKIKGLLHVEISSKAPKVVVLNSHVYKDEMPYINQFIFNFGIVFSGLDKNVEFFTPILKTYLTHRSLIINGPYIKIGTKMYSLSDPKASKNWEKASIYEGNFYYFKKSTSKEILVKFGPENERIKYTKIS